VAELDAKLLSLQTLSARNCDLAKEAESLISEREKSKRLVEQERNARNKLFAEKGDAVSKLTAAKADLDRQTGKLLDEGRLEEAIAVMKADNDKLEAEYHPKREEHSDISKEVDDANALLESLKASIKEAGRRNEEAEKDLKEAKKISEELVAISGPLPDKISKCNELSETVAGYKSAVPLLRELQDGSDAVRKETRECEDLLAERSAQAALFDADRNAYVLRLGAEVLRNTLEEEREHQVGS